MCWILAAFGVSQDSAAGSVYSAIVLVMARARSGPSSSVVTTWIEQNFLLAPLFPIETVGGVGEWNSRRNRAARDAGGHTMVLCDRRASPTRAMIEFA